MRTIINSTSALRPAANFAISKKAIYILIGILAVIGIIAWIVSSNSTPSTSQTNTQAPKALAKEIINKPFNFSLKDAKGNDVAQFTYNIASAELQKEVIINGQRADAISGREFLIINLKITNSTKNDFQLNTRDYVRLSVNKSNEMLAPDIHNDPVDVQPISTKYTRIGFPMNITDKNLVLHIGELEGNKQDIKLKL